MGRRTASVNRPHKAPHRRKTAHLSLCQKYEAPSQMHRYRKNSPVFLSPPPPSRSPSLPFTAGISTHQGLTLEEGKEDLTSIKCEDFALVRGYTVEFLNENGICNVK